MKIKLIQFLFSIRNEIQVSILDNIKLLYNALPQRYGRHPTYMKQFSNK